MITPDSRPAGGARPPFSATTPPRRSCPWRCLGAVAFIALVATWLAFITAGCSKQPLESAGPPAPSSGVSPDFARMEANRFAALIGGRVMRFSDTGSMLPYIDSRSVAVGERIDARSTTLHKGDIVAFEHPAFGYVCHRVTEVGKDGYVLTSGDNTSRGDGWQRPVYRLVSIYYTVRP